MTLDLTLTNRLHDTTTKRYFFDHAFLAVLPGATAYSATWAGSGRPTVSVARRTASYTLLRLNLAQDLSSGKTARYRLRSISATRAGTATRDLRIGDTLVSFPVWAFASDSTPGSSVTVVFPKGYQVAVEAGRIAGPTTLVRRADRLPERDPVRAARLLRVPRRRPPRRLPGHDHHADGRRTAGGSHRPGLVRRRRRGRQRIRRLLATGCRRSASASASTWPDYDKPLVVSEAVSRSTGGYAGIFDPSAGEVAIAYYADDFVVLHEAAHTWFNGSLLADRWSNEAFASYYAALAAGDLKLKVTTDRLTDALQKSRIPLNAWGAVGTLPVAQEDYAYAATLVLAREIAKRAGDRGLRDVWADAADRISAYQPTAGGEEIVAGQSIGGRCSTCSRNETGVAYDDLWRTWVARPSDLPLLDAAQDRAHEVRRRSSRRWVTGSSRCRSATRCARGASTRPRS